HRRGGEPMAGAPRSTGRSDRLAGVRPMRRWKSATHHTLAATLALLAASCTAIPTPEAPPPAPPPATPPAPPPAASPALPWDQRALDNGAWRYDAGSRTAA